CCRREGPLWLPFSELFVPDAFSHLLPSHKLLRINICAHSRFTELPPKPFACPLYSGLSADLQTELSPPPYFRATKTIPELLRHICWLFKTLKTIKCLSSLCIL
ncbi:hypothetical protein AMECASPLE_025751, partial [Ameca splendens]